MKGLLSDCGIRGACRRARRERPVSEFSRRAARGAAGRKRSLVITATSFVGDPASMPDGSSTTRARRPSRGRGRCRGTAKPARSSCSRHRPLAAEQQFLAHLAEREPNGGRGQREHRRPVQRAPERLRELAVRDRAADDVHRAGRDRSRARGGTRARRPGARPSTTTGPRCRPGRRARAGTAGASARRDPRARSRIGAWRSATTRMPAARAGLGRRFPRLDDVGGEPRTLRALLRDGLVAEPVVADARGLDERGRLRLERRQRPRDQARAVDAAPADPLARAGRPPLTDGLAGEVDDASRVDGAASRSGVDRRPRPGSQREVSCSAAGAGRTRQ